MGRQGSAAASIIRQAGTGWKRGRQLGRWYTFGVLNEEKALKILRVLALCLAVVAVPATAGRASMIVVNHENVQLANAAGQPASADQIRRAFESAATARGWKITHEAPGRMLASFNKQNKHMISCEITYSAGVFSLKYRDSLNMRYQPAGDGQGTIHPYYNKWVDFLIEDARAALAKS